MFDLFLLLFSLCMALCLLVRRVRRGRFLLLGICLGASTCHWVLSKQSESFSNSYPVARALPHSLLGRQVDALGPGFRVLAVDGIPVNTVGELREHLKDWSVDLKVISLLWKGRLEKIVFDRTFKDTNAVDLSLLGIVPGDRMVTGEGALFLQSAFLSVEYFQQVKETKVFFLELIPEKRFYFLKNSAEGFRALRARNRAFIIVENWLWDSHKSFFPLYKGIEVSPPVLFSKNSDSLLHRSLSLTKNIKNSIFSWNYLPWSWRELQRSPLDLGFSLGMVSSLSLLLLLFPGYLYLYSWITLLGVSSFLSLVSLIFMLSWPIW